jgi:uncharacterized protein YodC (DUF2158 family)
MHSTEQQQIRLGDLVRLHPGGPEMRVHRLWDEFARCTWTYRNAAQFGYFLLPLLVRVLDD